MAKQKGTLVKCLNMTKHHVGKDKVNSFVYAGEFTPETVEYRFGLVRANIDAALDQIEKVRAAAESKGCTEVLEALDDATLEFGHDY